REASRGARGAVPAVGPHVPRVDPALGVDRLRGLLRPLVVALHRHVAPDPDLARRAAGLLAAGRRVDDLELVARRGIARRLDALLLRGVERAERGAGAELAHAVTGDEPPQHVPRAARDGDGGRSPGREDARGRARTLP